jgi:hypothetical protein
MRSPKALGLTRCNRGEGPACVLRLAQETQRVGLGGAFTLSPANPRTKPG